MKDLTVLCKVIDNYGDIGFVYRLCRAISEITDEYSLRVVVSNLQSFSSMAPEINPSLPKQSYRGWTIYDWNSAEFCKKEFEKKPPQFMLECFQCGRPDWLEEIIFDENFTGRVQTMDLEYLTAEDWAEGFHKIKSGTRSINVKKHIFMPGFTNKTGGLVLDRSFMECAQDKNAALKKLEKESIKFNGNEFRILVFSYERNFDFLLKAASKMGESKTIRFYVAPGLAEKPFEEAMKNVGGTFGVEKLPYLPQEKWDALLTLMDFSFVRGEDSFARACLAGIPFLWHIYKQDEEYHLVKLDAFHQQLAKKSGNHTESQKDLLEKLTRMSYLYNKEGADQQELESLAEVILSRAEELKPLFEKFSQNLVSNGNLAENLLEFLSSLV